MKPEPARAKLSGSAKVEPLKDKGILKNIRRKQRSND